MSASSSNKSDSFSDGASVAITVRGKEIPAHQRLLAVSTLQYFPDNPRVYSVVRAGGKDPSQTDIEEALQGLEHVRELIQDIRRNGGLIDPLYVKDGSLEVIEGNSRLAALRVLGQDDPIRWSKAKCILLPATIENREIATLLGQWHLRGKKEWLPYEQAGFLYRRHREQGVDLDRLVVEVGLPKARVKQTVSAFSFMEKQDDREREHWSYYDEYTKSSAIRKARTKHPKLDEVIVAGIKSGAFERAQDFRDWLPILCEHDRVLKRFIKGDIDFKEAHDQAVEIGGDNSPLRRLKKFRVWLAREEIQEELAEASGKLQSNIRFEMDKIHRITGRLVRQLND